MNPSADPATLHPLRDFSGTILLVGAGRMGSALLEGWLALGAGAWDRLSRPSFVRLDRVIELRADAIRRQGAVLDPARFRYVADALRTRGGWD